MSEGVRYSFGRPAAKATVAEDLPTPSPVASRAAMRLALAYYVERCVENGCLESYAEAARRLGITRARMTQVMDMLLVPAGEQEETLLNS